MGNGKGKKVQKGKKVRNAPTRRCNTARGARRQRQTSWRMSTEKNQPTTRNFKDKNELTPASEGKREQGATELVRRIGRRGTECKANRNGEKNGGALSI